MKKCRHRVDVGIDYMEKSTYRGLEARRRWLKSKSELFLRLLRGAHCDRNNIFPMQSITTSTSVDAPTRRAEARRRVHRAYTHVENCKIRFFIVDVRQLLVAGRVDRNELFPRFRTRRRRARTVVVASRRFFLTRLLTRHAKPNELYARSH